MDERKCSNSTTSSEHEVGAPLYSQSPDEPISGETLQQLRPGYRLRVRRLKCTVISGTEAQEFLQDGLDERYLSCLPDFRPARQGSGDSDLSTSQHDEPHADVRQPLFVAYSRQVASPWVPHLIQSVRARVEEWQPGSEYGVMEQVERLASELYYLLMAGHQLKEYTPDCLQVTHYYNSISEGNWPQFIYRGPWFHAARMRALNLVRRTVLERRVTGATPERMPTIVDTLLRMTGSQGKDLTQDEVVGYAAYGFFDGCGDLARVAGFMLYELQQHPELMEQVTQEVEHVFAEGISNPTDVRKLRLLQAVYQEILRVYPLWQYLSYYARQDFAFHGKQFKKGERTVISRLRSGSSESDTQPPPIFDPARCLEPNGEHLQSHPPASSDRTGTAVGLTELMAVTMVATLLHEVRFTLSPPTYRLMLGMKPLPVPDSGFRIRVEAPRTRAEMAPRPAILVEEQVLASYPSLTVPRVQQALVEAKARNFPPHAVIIQQGDQADAFYVLIQGSALVTHTEKGTTLPLGRLREGDYFGEIGLLQNAERTATVTAGGDGAETLVVNRDTFLDVVAASDLVSEELARMIRKRVATQRLLEAWPSVRPESLERVMAEFDSQEYAAGEVIIREGDDANHFFILAEGEVVVSRETRSGNDEEVARLHPGEYFGEMGLLYRAPRKATVTVSNSGPARVLVTDRAGFQKLLGGTGGMRADLARAMLGRARQLAQHRS